MAQFAATVHIAYDGTGCPRKELIDWLKEATVLDFDSESHAMPDGVEDLACTIDWSSLKEVKR